MYLSAYGQFNEFSGFGLHFKVCSCFFRNVFSSLTILMLDLCYALNVLLLYNKVRQLIIIIIIIIQ